MMRVTQDLWDQAPALRERLRKKALWRFAVSLYARNNWTSARQYFQEMVTSFPGRAEEAVEGLRLLDLRKKEEETG